jgi:hypothetical protein
VNQVIPGPLMAAAITVFLALLGFSGSLGALFWRMRAAEARLRVIEKGQVDDRVVIAELSGQLGRLDATLNAFSENVKTLTQLLTTKER